jgi:hypothetical protein
MVVVGLVAVAFGGMFRGVACRERAGQYERQGWNLRALAETIRGQGPIADLHLSSGMAVGPGWAVVRGVRITSARELEAMATGFDQAARERDRMRRRCVRAFFCLWESVPPAPPPFQPEVIQ